VKEQENYQYTETQSVAWGSWRWASLWGGTRKIHNTLCS
jgi:hypothetical protein